MEFEWDEAKRERNLTKHGVDFLLAEMLFDARSQQLRAPGRRRNAT
jgi:uncharacterized DUF497 family protein